MKTKNKNSYNNNNKTELKDITCIVKPNLEVLPFEEYSKRLASLFLKKLNNDVRRDDTIRSDDNKEYSKQKFSNCT